MKTYKQNGKTAYVHGMRNTRIYDIWAQMKQRCTNEKNNAYPSYGGRGIDVCDEFSTFVGFCEWANNNGYSDELSIDRIDNDKGYSPENCRWTTVSMQNVNTRKRKDNVSGVTGVGFHKISGKYRARLNYEGKSMFIGGFNTLEEAVIARDAYIHVNSLPHKTTHKFKRIEIGA